MTLFIDTFISCVTKELKECKPNPITHNNLSLKGRQTLKELSSRYDVIVTKADKGGAIVILDVKDYVDETDRQTPNITVNGITTQPKIMPTSFATLWMK